MKCKETDRCYLLTRAQVRRKLQVGEFQFHSMN